MKNKAILIIAAIIIFLLLISTAVGVVLWQKASKEKSALKSKLESNLKKANKKVRKLKKKNISRKKRVENQEEENQESSQPENNSTTSSTTSKEFGFIKKVYDNSSDTYLVIDYAQMLSGSQAETAAVQDGFIQQGETLDNDYYIRNQSKKLRTFKISQSVKITINTNGNNSVPITLSKFKNLISGDSRYSDSPYWIKIKSDIVQNIDEQYLP